MRRHSRSGKRNSSPELLEDRLLLTSGLAWTEAPNLTLSFAPDGSNVAGHESNLHQLMDAVGTRGQWRTAMRQGFETWTSLIDADVTVVDDEGQAFGTSGAPYLDSRFGDIRIAAIPINQDTYAMSIAHDEFVAGTWAGDIILNSNAKFESVDDVFRILLHEAGHVLGLDHSTDPDSPMFEHGIPASITPTEEDTDELRELYGFEKDDGEGDREQKESDDDDIDNNEFATAVPLNPTNGFPKRRYTLEGRIREQTDVDIYKFQGYEDVDTELEVTTFVLRSTERGHLVPQITLYDDRGDLIDKVDVLQNGSGSLVIQTEEIDPEDDYFIKIDAAVSGDETRSLGDYHLTISSRVEEVEPREFADGTLQESSREGLHSVYLARAQLISFALEIEPTEAPDDTTVGVALFDHEGGLITTTSAGVGETRSLDSLLLRAGTYYVSIKAESDAVIPELEYKLLAISSTKEAGPLPSDPTGDPAFPCNDGTPDFCYPDGHRSPDPTHANSGTGTNPPELDRYAILLSWLSWWPEDNVNAGWVDPNNDAFVVPQNSSTALDVLSNDSGAAAIEVQSVEQPANGSVAINPDGSLRFESAGPGLETFGYSIGAVQATIETPAGSVAEFGSSVGAFGNLAVVGAPFADENGTDSGAAYVFRNVGGDWVFEQQLTPTDGAVGDRFGTAVAVHGTTIVVTSPYDDDLGRNSGSAYVFEFDPINATFEQQKRINDPKGQAKDLFGDSVAIEGSTIVVGARLDDGLGTNSGSAFVFNRNRGGSQNWGFRKRLKASTAAGGSQFGSSVDISNGTIVVGARRDDVTGINAGGAYVFERHAGGTNKYGEVARLAPTGVGNRDEFGTDVGVSGTTVVVGAPLNDVGGRNAGAAFVFERDHGGDNAWGQVVEYYGAKIGDKTGRAVAVDGEILVVSSPSADPGVKSGGSARVYRFDIDGAAWLHDYDVTADDPQTRDQIGVAVDVFDGRVLLGAPRSDRSGHDAGLVVVEDTRRATAQVSVEVGAPLHAASLGIADSRAVPPAFAQLETELANAFEFWNAAPVPVSIQFADLDGTLLGLTIGHRILIDIDAAGHGWSVDTTAPGMSLSAAVTHEVGHVLGFEDTIESSDSVMHGYLRPADHHASSHDHLFRDLGDLSQLFDL